LPQYFPEESTEADVSDEKSAKAVAVVPEGEEATESTVETKKETALKSAE
jgi:hypothetical protein